MRLHCTASPAPCSQQWSAARSWKRRHGARFMPDRVGARCSAASDGPVRNRCDSEACQARYFSPVTCKSAYTGRVYSVYRPPLRLFGITSDTLVRSCRSSSGPAGGASDGCGLGRGAVQELRARTGGVRQPRLGRSESSFRTDPSVCPIMLRHRYR